MKRVLLLARFKLCRRWTTEAIMTAKEISVKKYVVRLSAEEREQLEALIRKGKSPAQRLLKARILLKADVSEAGEGWSDSRIIKALETSPSMVYRVRKQLVEEGFEAVLSRKQRATPAVGAHFRRRGRKVELIGAGVLQAARGTRRRTRGTVGEHGGGNSASSIAPATSTIGLGLLKRLSNPIARQCWVIPPKAR